MVNIQNLNKIIEFSKTLTILYVEDNQDSRESTLKMLNHFFDNIIIAEDGLIGLDKFKTNQESIDIVLTDINMPNMNGIEMLESIRDLDKLIPCIILSAHDEIDFFLRSIKLGIDGYILKPVEIKQFVDVLSKIIYYITLEKEKEKSIKVLLSQSRFASMGEMISMIAHQWRQPLSTINGVVAPLDLKFKMGMEVDPQDAIEKFARQNEIVQHLSTTIEDFLGFFKENGYNEMATISQIIETPKRLISAGLGEQDVKIDVVYTIDENFQFKTKPSKFDQVLMNIYKNALDEFKSKDQKNGIITVVVAEHNDNIILEIQDNAGGIPEDVLPNIWDAYFSTKDKNGTGIGLYMTKILVEKHLGGTIKASNRDNGAVFSICIPIIK